MSSLWLDVRYALRAMATAPTVTLVLIVTLAIGIGASTTMFSIVDSVLLEPLPYEEPDQLVRLYAKQQRRSSISPNEYDDVRATCRSCAGAGGWSTTSTAITGSDRPLRVDAAYATHTLVPVLGVQPRLGRWLDASEQRAGDPSVIVLGDALWRRAFGADPDIVGKTIRADGIPVVVIGVMPPGFAFPAAAEAWLPLADDRDPDYRGGHDLDALVRLAPGATLTTLQAELDALAATWAATHGPNPQGTVYLPLVAVPLHADVVGPIATMLWLLQAAALLVLLIAVVNIASVLLARAEARTREVAIRYAIGASYRRLARQFITEATVPGVVGGALGVLVAAWGVDGAVALIPSGAPRVDEIALDLGGVVFAIAVTFSATLVLGLAPILHARRSDFHGALKDSSPRATASRSRLRVRRGLVISQIALAVVLVVASATTVQIFARLSRTELGFAPDHLLTFHLSLPERDYPGVTGDALWHRLEDRLRAVPGVTSAALVYGLPPERRKPSNWFGIPGRPLKPGFRVDFWQFIGTDALETLGARLDRGRTILASDTADAPDVVVINQAFAAKFFPGVDPIGRRLQLHYRGERLQTVVGVVADIVQDGLDQPAGTEVFFPLAQARHLDDPPHARTMMWALVRTIGDPRAAIPAVQRAVLDLDPTLPLSHVRTMDEVLGDAIARPRFLMALLVSFAVIALVLAGVGIYGVMAHTVAQRTHELGLRLALGALPSDVRALVLRQAFALVGAGVAVGLTTAIALQLALDRWLSKLLYGDRLADPWMFAATAVVVSAIALIAAWLPARRATRIEPLVALRAE